MVDTSLETPYMYGIETLESKMFYVIMNRDLYLHRDEEQYTQDYENAAQFPTHEAAEHSKGHGGKVVGPCNEGEEP